MNPWDNEVNKLSASELRKLTDKSAPINPREAEPVKPSFKGETAVLVATGPSLTDEQLTLVKEHHDAGNCRVFTINNVYQRVPWTDVHISCDAPWWRWYGERSKELLALPCPKYTWYPELADRFNIDYIKGINKPGLSTDPSVVHINHGSSPMCVNLALHYGIKRLLLIGHDMKYAADYNPKKRDHGSTPRNYSDEYPGTVQHWPSVKVGLYKPGVNDGLIETYNNMVPQLKKLGMEVINCTPDSALTTFPMSTLEEEL